MDVNSWDFLLAATLHMWTMMHLQFSPPDWSERLRQKEEEDVVEGEGEEWHHQLCASYIYINARSFWRDISGSELHSQQLVTCPSASRWWLHTFWTSLCRCHCVSSFTALKPVTAQSESGVKPLCVHTLYKPAFWTLVVLRCALRGGSACRRGRAAAPVRFRCGLWASVHRGNQAWSPVQSSEVVQGKNTT